MTNQTALVENQIAKASELMIASAALKQFVVRYDEYMTLVSTTPLSPKDLRHKLMSLRGFAKVAVDSIKKVKKEIVPPATWNDLDVAKGMATDIVSGMSAAINNDTSYSYLQWSEFSKLVDKIGQYLIEFVPEQEELIEDSEHRSFGSIFGKNILWSSLLSVAGGALWYLSKVRR